MLTIFKKLFGKPEPKAVKVIATPQQAAAEPTVAMPSVEVAHLSLAAIVSHLPDDLKAFVRQAPADNATVALPMPTILKQLSSGCVKMSLASLNRQAHGVFSPLPGGDKRTVDIPLAEIFRHVNVHALRRRPDQRPVRLPENGFNLFGNAENPYQICPTAVEAPRVDSTVLDLTPDMSRGIKMGSGLREPLANAAKSRGGPIAPPAGVTSSQRVVAPPPGFGPKAPTPPEPAPREDLPPVILALAPIAESWPAEVRAELATALESGSSVALPSSRLSEGLAKGRVAFTWGQICRLVTPDPVSPGAVDENTSLMIPLRIVAPAFLSSSNRAKAPRKGVYLDASIPALFTGASAKPAAPPMESVPPPVLEIPAVDLPAPESEPESAPESEHEQQRESGPGHDSEAQPQSEPAQEQEPEPVSTPPLTFSLAPSAEPLPPPAPVFAEHGKLPESVGEVFGNPHKVDWTPAEIVHNTVKLPGVAGAVVALQEGLQVASSLPDGVKSDVVAAFLPQIFARLNQYAGEMRLGDVDDLLFTTHGAHCQIYRLGYVYFAVLGKPGESLPWHELRLVSEELARQTNK